MPTWHNTRDILCCCIIIVAGYAWAQDAVQDENTQEDQITAQEDSTALDTQAPSPQQDEQPDTTDDTPESADTQQPAEPLQSESTETNTAPQEQAVPDATQIEQKEMQEASPEYNIDDTPADNEDAASAPSEQDAAQEETGIPGDTYYGQVQQSDMEAFRDDIDDISQEQEQEIVTLERPKAQLKSREDYMSLQFDEKPLSQIVDDLAEKKGFNVVLPHGEEAIEHKITFKHASQVPLSRAERYVYLFLDLAGYQMYPHGSYYIVTKKPDKPEQNMRSPSTLYVNVPPDELPQSQEEIQAIYSLANLRVPEREGGNEPITQLLKNTLSRQKSYMYDQNSNSIIISDNAYNIASAMNILLHLDSSESSEVLQSLQLYNSSAQTVADLLNEQIIAQAQDSKSKEPQKLSTTRHFAPNVHVVADTRRNRLLLLGRDESISKIENFVREYIDVPQDTGKSILHVYELQYLDAKEFAEVLKKLVQPIGTQGRQAQKKQEETGPRRHFEDVIIMAEPEQQVEAGTAQEGTQQQKRLSIGGNRLIVAARNEDWQRLRDIIADLDKPQKQVIIEVMIADVSLTNLKQLGSQTRNPNIVDLPHNMNIQASHLNNGPVLNQSQTSLVGDLLRLLDGSGSIAGNLINTNASPSESGAMLLSIADPYDGNKIWSIFKLLDKYIESKILSHPFLVTRDNIQAQAKAIDIRRQTGGLAEGASQSVSPTTNIKDYEAKLVVNVTPRVSSLERLNMQIDIDIQDFIGDSVDKNTRKISTNANMQTGQVLVLGGLSRNRENSSERETPFLSKLPVIGHFFKSQTKEQDKTNLAVFLTPTIVEPKLRQGMHRYTNHKIEERYEEAQGNIFESLSQPITHFFFNNMDDEGTPLDNYLDEVQYKQQQKEKLSQDFIYDPRYEIMKSYSREDTDALQGRLQDEENPLAQTPCK